MSTVVSAIRGGVIHMCGDTACTKEHGTQNPAHKVFKGDGYLVAAVGDKKYYAAMVYEYKHPADNRFSSEDYILQVRDALRFVLTDFEGNYAVHLGFFYQGEPCLIEYTGDVGDIEEITDMRWLCQGNGAEVATGVMAVLWDTDMDTRTLLEKAIEVASRYDAYTALPSEHLCLTD